MIDEHFLQSAVNLRRNYLKLINNMDFYHQQAKEVVKKLEGTVDTINSLGVDYKESVKQKKHDNQGTLNNLLKLIQEIEDEGKKIEELINPMNTQIEKLSIEEAELYRKIKERHSDLTEEQIVKSVRDRLIRENLS
jgi:chromosome segregation ATPase